jgi:pimeloyl-ACP methyl ester carboxylesterase
MNPDAHLGLPGIARMINDFMGALDLEDVVLVGNDTGGALVQIVCTQYKERLGALVLITCDAFDNFRLCSASSSRGLLMFPPCPRARAAGTSRRKPSASANPARLDAASMGARRTPLVSHSVGSEQGHPARCQKCIAWASSSPHARAAEQLPYFAKPVLIVWNPGDR